MRDLPERRRRLRRWVCGVPACVLLAGCSLLPPPSGHLTILSYNLQNLFDGRQDGTEYREFDPSRGSWNAQAFHDAARRDARLIRRATRGGPDVLCLQEAENARVVSHLATGPLRRLGYAYAAVSDTPGAAVEVAVLSRLPISRLRVHAPVTGWPDGRHAREQVLRPVLEARLDTEVGPVHLFCNHWKSKSGGARETEPARRAAARVVARRVRELRAATPAPMIVVAGDFNEAPGAYPEVAALYSPWADAEAPGSYRFRGEWERLDDILLSTALVDGSGGWRYAGFEVVRRPFAMGENGEPVAAPHGGRRGAGGSPDARPGYSDHFPVLLTLRRAADAD